MTPIPMKHTEIGHLFYSKGVVLGSPSKARFTPKMPFSGFWLHHVVSNACLEGELIEIEGATEYL